MEVFDEVMYCCMQFLNTKFTIYYFEFSLWEVSMLIMAFQISINFIARMFGKQDVSVEDW